MRSATKEAKPAVRIADHPAYAEAAARLETLKPKLEEAKKRLQILTERAGSVAKRAFNSGIGVLPNMTDAVFDDMARKIAANSGDIPDALMDRLRFGAVKPRFPDENDTEAFNTVADATRRVELLTRAVVVQERAVVAIKKLAIAAACESTQSVRSRIAREVADAVLSLAIKLSEENAIVAGLREQDSSIPGLLRPSPFPRHCTRIRTSFDGSPQFSKFPIPRFRPA